MTNFLLGLLTGWFTFAGFVSYTVISDPAQSTKVEGYRECVELLGQQVGCSERQQLNKGAN